MYLSVSLNFQSNTEFLDLNDDSLFPRQIGIKEATLLLVKEKIGRYSLLRVRINKKSFINTFIYNK